VTMFGTLAMTLAVLGSAAMVCSVFRSDEPRPNKDGSGDEMSQRRSRH
jgi:hypothetical protein